MYQATWEYCWRNFVDHHHGGWYRILSPTNAKLEETKSPAGRGGGHASMPLGLSFVLQHRLLRAGKVDYHTLG
jgi:hypothetical protein